MSTTTYGPHGVTESTLRRIVYRMNIYPHRVGCEPDDLLQMARIYAWQGAAAKWGVIRAFQRWGPVPQTHRERDKRPKAGTQSIPRPKRREFADSDGNVTDVPEWLLTCEIEDPIDRERFLHAVARALPTLTERQYEAFIQDETDEALAARHGCTQNAIRDCRMGAIKKLRKHPQVAALVAELHGTFT